jgi:hypothetical protein
VTENHYTPSKDGMHETYKASRRYPNRVPLPPKLSPLDEELIANLEAEVFDHEPDCICDRCHDLRVLKMEE